MIGYYLELALHGLRRNVPLTALMIVAIGVGVGASVTLTTALQAMSADPIPQKSAQLFTVRIDNWSSGQANNEASQDQVAYPDARGLLRGRPELRQSPMYALNFNVMPARADVRQFSAPARAVTADFFAMFLAPFATGTPWQRSDDATQASVVVLGRELPRGFIRRATRWVG